MMGTETSQIYMIKKRKEGTIVSFRMGTNHGIKPGMQLDVVNEDGFLVGIVEIFMSTETESEALIVGQNSISLGCSIKTSGSAKQG